MARENWQTIGNIKNLKEGYISQVIHEIVKIIKEKPTYIVLEDLNTGFKRGRQKIEKQVYQKFEVALAKKLNFLVDKTAQNGEIGSVTNALQLTPPVVNYQDIESRKQVGVMLYTRANYTSQTDPLTGWRKTIYLKKGSEENIKEQIVKEFKDIDFDGKDYFFTYEDKNTKKLWTFYSSKDGKSLDRFRGVRGKDKNEWTIEKINIIEILDGIFAKFDKTRSLLSQLIDENKELTKTNEHTAYESLRFAIDLIQQIRNTGELDMDNDFLQSPVRDINGNHFDSRLATDKQPNSGDANGAYNIARKGIIMNEHIKRNYRLFISDAEWDAWLAENNIWEEWIKDNQDILKNNKKK
jgi:CRISPR-associated protein Cpf1